MHVRRVVAPLIGACILAGTASAAEANVRPAARPAVSSSGMRVDEFVATTGSDSTGGMLNDCTDANTPCATIQHAIDVAAATQPTVIHVGVGNFPEQLVIQGKRVTIVGEGIRDTAIDPSTLAPSDADPQSADDTEAVAVSFEDGSRGDLDALRVEADQASVAPSSSCVSKLVAVQFAESNGVIHRADVSDTSTLAQTGDCPTVSGTGVYAAAGSAVHAVSIAFSDIGYGQTGLDCEGPQISCDMTAFSDVSPGGTPAAGEQYGVAFRDGAHGDVTEGSRLAGADAGVFADGDGHLAVAGDMFRGTGGVLVTNRGPRRTTIANNSFSGASNAVEVDNSSNVTVAGNRIRGGGNGIVLTSDTSVTLGRGNLISRVAGFGISIGGTSDLPSTGNTITHNVIRNSHAGGIHAAGPDGSGNPTQAGNVFTHNRLGGNRPENAEDGSVGAGTAGTANTWTQNTCLPAGDSSIPTGLCTS